MAVTQKKPPRRAARGQKTTTVADRLRARMEREARLSAKTPPAPLTEKLFNISAAAERLGLSPWTLRHWLAEGKLNYRRISRRVYLTESEIARLSGVAVAAVAA